MLRRFLSSWNSFGCEQEKNLAVYWPLCFSAKICNIDAMTRMRMAFYYKLVFFVYSYGHFLLFIKLCLVTLRFLLINKNFDNLPDIRGIGSDVTKYSRRKWLKRASKLSLLREFKNVLVSTSLLLRLSNK